MIKTVSVIIKHASKQLFQLKKKKKLSCLMWQYFFKNILNKKGEKKPTIKKWCAVNYHWSD